MSRRLIFRAISYGIVPLLAAALQLPAAGIEKKQLPPNPIPSAVPAIWHDPVNIRSRNLYYGLGGRKDEPRGPFTFLKEDLDGTNPKFTVRDRDGVKWKVKLGEEARPETVASRFVWAVGYTADEDYFLPNLTVEKMPAHLHRGQKLIDHGSMHNVRLKREPKDEKKLGVWQWRNDPFNGTRPWNGLRVMMALMNNWDLKDVNNAIRIVDGKPEFMVSDLGASFGTTGWSVTRAGSKGNLKAYQRSTFIARTTPEYVSFTVPTRPAWIHLVTPIQFIQRLHLEWIGKRIPVDDARWMGSILARLSHRQVEDAFRAADYQPAQVQAFSAVVEERIAELNKL